MINNNYKSILVLGNATTGKTTSLYPLRDRSDVVYINADAGRKSLPFKGKFKQKIAYHPDDVHRLFQSIHKKKMVEKGEVGLIVVDTINFLMNIVEEKKVTPFLGVHDFGKCWTDYFQFFNILVNNYCASLDIFTIFMAHTMLIQDAETGHSLMKVPVKGQLKAVSVEAFFANIVSTKKMNIEELEEYKSPYLNITEEEKEYGFKYVFQTSITADALHEEIRSPLGMWSKEERYIDNNIQFVMERIEEYNA